MTMEIKDLKAGDGGKGGDGGERGGNAGRGGDVTVSEVTGDQTNNTENTDIVSKLGEGAQQIVSNFKSWMGDGNKGNVIINNQGNTTHKSSNVTHGDNINNDNKTIYNQGYPSPIIPGVGPEPPNSSQNPEPISNSDSDNKGLEKASTPSENSSIRGDQNVEEDASSIASEEAALKAQMAEMKRENERMSQELKKAMEQEAARLERERVELEKREERLREEERRQEEKRRQEEEREKARRELEERLEQERRAKGPLPLPSRQPVIKDLESKVATLLLRTLGGNYEIKRKSDYSQ